MAAILWKVNDEHLLVAAEWASKKLFNSIDRPKMNERGMSEALDDKIMGDIATIAIVEYVRSIGLQAVAYDQIRDDEFKEPDPGWDIAIAEKGLNKWAKETDNPRVPPRDQCFTLSVKSSRLVRDEAVEIAIGLRDFKIFSHNANDISSDLTSDIEAQVYYPLEKTQLRNASINESDIRKCILNRRDCSLVTDCLAIHNRYDICILTAWDFSKKIEQYSNTLSANKKTWSSFGKRMWFAPLKNGKSFCDIGTIFNEFGG